jgi:putative membrane protein
MNARVSLTLAALALCASACGKSDTQKAADSAAAVSAAPANSTATMAPAAAPAPANSTATAPAKPSDPQIAHIAVTSNSIDSAAGVLAKQKGTAKSVKDFAQTMITDHSGVNKQATALAKKLNLTPEDNDVSRQLKSAADQNVANLQGKTGADFDKAYIDNEVTYHQNLLDALDKTLIPNTQNAELKALLEKVRPAVVAHLERAKKVQAGLGNKA